MIEFGAGVEELVWDDIVEWRDADGDPHLVRPLARIAPRPTKSIDSVRFDRGRLVEVKQLVPDAKPIPGWKVSHLILERDGDAWDGISMLRPAWGPWRMKKSVMISAGIAWDRFSGGLPIVGHPDNPEDERKAQEIGRSIRQHERAYVNLPREPGGDDDQAWKIDLLKGADAMADPVGFLRWLSHQEAEAALTHFSQLGLTESGSRATAETQIDPFFLSVQSISEYLRLQRQRQVIRRIVRVNFGEDAAANLTPKLTVTKIQARNVETITRAIAILAEAGFKLDDRGVQNDVRELLGFQPLPDDLEDLGISRVQLVEILRGLGIDQETFAAIVAALPEEFGVSANSAEGRPPAALAS